MKLPSHFVILTLYWFSLVSVGRAVHTETKLCSKSVCVQTNPGGGIGHRLYNLLQGVMVSQALNISKARQNLEISNPVKTRGHYEGANHLFTQLNQDVIECPTTKSAPLGWHIEHLEFHLERGAFFEMNSDQVQKMRGLVEKAACNTVFIVKEFWPGNNDVFFPILQNRFKLTVKTATGQHIVNQLSFVKSRFNIAIHFRNGDIRPTAVFYFKNAIGQMLSELKQISAFPVDITIFSENGAELHREIQKISKKSGMDVHVVLDEKSSALLTMFHFIHSDIFVAADSSMSLVSTWLCDKTTLIVGPGKTIRAFPPMTVKAEFNGSYNDSGKIIASAKLWLDKNACHAP